MRTYDISEIASMLASRAEDVCRWLLPNGVREGHEWCCGDLSGEPGRSLKVNLSGKAGVWRDFADSDKGGDLVDLIQAVCGVSKADAVATAKEWLGIKDFKPNFSAVKKNYSRPKVAPCVGARIETIILALVALTLCVAPCVGAWIETCPYL